MRYQRLGKTELQVSEVSFGCIPIIRLSTEEAVKVLQFAYDQGITFYDTANAYRDSEYKLGKAFQGMRDKVMIASKTMKRDGKGAVEQLDNTLKMLNSDYIDLYQFHQVAQERDWEALTSPGGAFEAIMKAKEQGKIRHVGITSHSLSMAVRFVKTGLFETIQFPFNFIEDAAKDELHPAARAADMGILVMKPFAGGAINNASLAFKFLRQYPDAIPIPGFDSVASIKEILAFYKQPNKIEEADWTLMEEFRKELGQQFCRRCEYCQPCPQGVMITPAMGYHIVVKRMSPEVAVDFSKLAMESVPKCVDCGICVTRCPYDLPIPDILKRNYNVFKEQRAALASEQP